MLVALRKNESLFSVQFNPSMTNVTDHTAGLSLGDLCIAQSLIDTAQPRAIFDRRAAGITTSR